VNRVHRQAFEVAIRSLARHIARGAGMDDDASVAFAEIAIIEALPSGPAVFAERYASLHRRWVDAVVPLGAQPVTDALERDRQVPVVVARIDVRHVEGGPIGIRADLGGDPGAMNRVRTFTQIVAEVLARRAARRAWGERPPPPVVFVSPWCAGHSRPIGSRP
jgi:hypothetical protein